MDIFNPGEEEEEPDFIVMGEQPAIENTDTNEEDINIPKPRKVRWVPLGHGWLETDEVSSNTRQFEEELKSINENMVSQGYRESNLLGMHNSAIMLEKSTKNQSIERIVCRNCQEPFLVNINGNRLVIDSNKGNFIVVKFVELLAVCPKCNTSSHIDLHGIYDPQTDDEYDEGSQELEDVMNGVQQHNNLGGDYFHAQEEMEKRNLVDVNKRHAFLKDEMIKDRRNKIV